MLLSDELKQCTFSAGLKGVAAADVDKVEAVVMDTLRAAAADGCVPRAAWVDDVLAVLCQMQIFFTLVAAVGLKTSEDLRDSTSFDVIMSAFLFVPPAISALGSNPAMLAAMMSATDEVAHVP